MYILIYRRNRKDTKSRRYRHNIAGRIDMRTLTRRFVLLAAMIAPLGAYGVNAHNSPQGGPQGTPLAWPAGKKRLAGDTARAANYNHLRYHESIDNHQADRPLSTG